MDLSVILGPPGAGKAGRVVAAIEQLRIRPGGVMLVVPSMVDKSRFLRELAARSGTLLDVEVGTWSVLAQRITQAPVRQPDAAMERVLMRQALAAEPAFAQARLWRGFTETARQHIIALRRGRVWGDELFHEARAALPGGDVLAWESLLARYNELLRERRLFDDAWYEQQAQRRCETGEIPLGGLVVYETMAPSSQHVRLVEALAEHIPVRIALPWRAGRGLHDAVAELHDRWVRRGAHVVTLEAESTSHPVLDWLSSELFEPAPSNPPAASAAPVGDVAPLRLVECSGMGQEAEAIADEIGRLLHAGFEPGSIAVTAANPERGAALVTGALARVGIPLAPMLRRRAIDVPAGRTLGDIVTALRDDDGDAFVAALAGAASPMRSRSAQFADIERRSGGGFRTLADVRACDAVVRLLPDSMLLLVDAVRDGDSVLEPVLDLIASMRPSSDGEFRVLTALASVIESLATAAGGAEFIHLDDIAAAITQHALRIPDRVDEGRVVLASINDLGSARFDAVIVYGLHHGAFHAPAEHERYAPAAARDLAHLAFTRARSALRLIRQHADADGGVVAPHTVWLEIERLAARLPEGCVERTHRSLGAVVALPEDVLFERDAPLSVVRAEAEGRVVTGVGDELRANCEHATRNRLVPLVVDDAAGARLAGLERIAATELEAYARCPVQWLLRREHPLRDLDQDRTHMLAGLYAHALLQRAVPLLLASAATHPVGPTEVTESINELIGRNRREALRASGADAVLAQHEQTRVETQVSELLAVELEPGRTLPSRTWVEVPLDAQRPASAAAATPTWAPGGLDIDGVEVFGRVDRIDAFDDGVVLHDYKSGDRTISPKKLAVDGAMQLGLYWLAIERDAAAPDPVAAVYRALPKQGELWGLRSTILKTYGLVGPRQRPPDDDTIRLVLDDIESRARELIASIKRGQLDLSHLDPSDDRSPCARCSLRSICRIDERRSAS